MIVFENKPSTKTPINDKNLNANFSEAVEKNIITASVSSNYSIQADSTYEMLPLNVHNYVGTKLTLKDGKIVIGENVNFVKISAKLSFNSLYAGLKWLTVFDKNNAAILANPNQLSGRTTITCTEAVVPVKQGDTIELRVQGIKDDVVRGGLAYTNLTVEVVK